MNRYPGCPKSAVTRDRMPHPARSSSKASPAPIHEDEIGAHIRQLPRNMFIRASDLPGSASDGTRALRAAASAGDVIRVRHGLYWNGDAPPTALATIHALYGDY